MTPLRLYVIDLIKIMKEKISLILKLWLCIFCLSLLEACSTTHYVAQTKRSLVEQLLLTKAVDKAIDKLDTHLNLAKKKVYIDTASLAPDEEGYLKKAIALWCIERGAIVVDKKEEADYVVAVLVKSLGTDQIKSVLMGIPSLPIPFTNTTTPQINLLVADRQKGYTEMEIMFYDSHTGKVLLKTKPLVGKTFFGLYKIFILPITREDIFEK